MMKKEQKDNIPKIKYYTDFIGKLHFSSEEKAAIAKKVTAMVEDQIKNASNTNNTIRQIDQHKE